MIIVLSKFKRYTVRTGTNLRGTTGTGRRLGIVRTRNRSGMRKGRVDDPNMHSRESTRHTHSALRETREWNEWRGGRKGQEEPMTRNHWGGKRHQGVYVHGKSRGDDIQTSRARVH